HRLRDVDEADRKSRLREDLGDAVAHRAAADHTDGLDLHPTIKTNHEGTKTRRRLLVALHWRSTASATPLPPPRQSVAIPRCTLRCLIAYSSVVSTREPLEPIACPSATAPPLTLTRPGSMPSSRGTATAWQQNASFSPKRPTARRLQ